MSVAVNIKSSLQRPPLLVITGPTASGKSSLALALSRLVPVTIINADASQVYADLRIITARPSVEEEGQAQHTLFGHVDGAVACSAADWAAEAKQAIAASRDGGRIPVLVGGTGLYLQTLLNGIAPVPEIDAAVRSEVRAMRVDEAHAHLVREDPEAAARLSANDTTRVCRALEVVRSSGRTLKAWQETRIGGIGEDVRLIPMILLPPRDWLHERCDARFVDMLGGGAVDEVAQLMTRGLDPMLPVMRAIGVREIAAMLAGDVTRDATIKVGQIATRQYTKRQYTWFRNQPPATWPRITEQLNNDLIDDLVIKLRNAALTD
jgi:tRNA dimethylallyltransferase